jgi:hypothetical protein
MAGYTTLARAFAAVKKYDFDARIDADLASVMDLGLPHVGTSAPVTFYPGKVWLDTTSGVVRQKICSAVSEQGVATWVSIDPAPAHVGATAPTDFYVGKLWMDTTNGAVVLKVCTAVAEGSATWTACFTSGT